MTDIFQDTGVKRYVIRRRENFYSPWEYPSEFQYNTLEEARAALTAMPLSGGRQIAEMYPGLRYQPGAVPSGAPLLSRLLETERMKPYALQRLDRTGTWETLLDSQYDTLEEAGNAAAGGQYRVAAAVVNIRYEPVEGA